MPTTYQNIFVECEENSSRDNEGNNYIDPALGWKIVYTKEEIISAIKESRKLYCEDGDNSELEYLWKLLKLGDD